MATLPVIDLLQQLADDPAAPDHYRHAARHALQRLAQACDVATRWGYDENAELRVRAFQRAATAGPGELGEERIELGLALDELCRAVGVPLEGPATAGE